MAQGSEPRDRWRGPSWPSHPDMLVDTARCPVCFTGIAASPCPSCGFDLGDPRTFDVLELSQRIVQLVDARADLLEGIGPAAHVVERPVSVSSAGAARVPATMWPAPTVEEMHAEVGGAPAPGSGPGDTVEEMHAGVGGAPASGSGPVDEAAAPQPEVSAPPSREAMPVRPVAPPMPPPPVSPVGRPEVASAPTRPAAVAPVASLPSESGVEPRRPRRSGVQVFLLSIGVVLLAVAAVFFLTVAWVNGGIGLRSVIIGLLTAGVIATASLLRRKRLTATAEGIAALGIALVALDAWAVRANDLAGAATVDPLVYGGVAGLAAGAGSVAWARATGLRVPLTLGVVLGLAGAGLLAAGLVHDTSGQWYALGLTILTIALAAPLVPRLSRGDLPRPRVEVAIVHAMGAMAAGIAALAGLSLAPEAAWAPLLAGLPVSAVLGLHAVVLARQTDARSPHGEDGDGGRWLAPVAGAAAVLVLGAAVAAALIRLADATLTATVPILVGVVVSLVLEAAATRARGHAARAALSVTAITAAAGTALAVLVAMPVALRAFAGPMRAAFSPFLHRETDVFPVDASGVAVAVVFVAVVVMAGAVWRWTGRWAERRTVLLSGAAVVLLLIGIQVRVLLLIVVWYLLLAAIAVILLRRGRLPRPLTAATAAAAALVAETLSFSSPGTWAVTTVVVAALLVGIAPLSRTVRTGAAAVLAMFLPLSGLAVPAALDAGASVTIPGMTAGLAATLVAALVALVATVVTRGPFDDAARRVSAVIGVGLAAIGTLGVVLLTDTAPRAACLLVAVMIALGAVTTILLRRRAWSAARLASAASMALFTGVAAGAATYVARADGDGWDLALGAAVVLVAAFAVVGLRTDPLVRTVTDGGAVVVGFVAVTISSPERGWLILLLLSAAALLWSVDVDGLFVSRRLRRHLIWLASALGVAALWWRLSSENVESAEAYTLPVAGVLLVIGLCTERARRRVEGRGPAPSAAILFVAALVAAVPSALVDTGDIGRSAVVAAAAAVLLLAGAWTRVPRTPELLPLSVSVAGGVGLLVATAVRSLGAARRPLVDTLVVDVFVGLAAVVLIVAAVGMSRRTLPGAMTLARATAVAGIATAAVGSVVIIVMDSGPLLRVIPLILALGAGAVASRRWSRAPFDFPVTVAGLVGATLIAAVAIAAGVRPIEWATVPLALVLAAAGLATWRRRPEAAGQAAADSSGADSSATVAGFAAVGSDSSATAGEAVTRGSAALAVSGLAVGLLPSALLAGDSPVRAVVVAVVAAALVLTPAVSRSAGRIERVALPGLAVPTASLVIAGAIRVVVDLETAAFDAWTAVTVIPLLAAGALLERRPVDRSTRSVGSALTVTALVVATVFTAGRFWAVETGPLRISVVMALLLIVGLFWPGRDARPVWWATVGLSAALAAVALAAGRADPVESVTMLLAAALVVDGVRALRRDPDLGSWPALGLGLALLLIPPLLFDLSGGNALWRVILLGVVALVVLLAGVRGRLQAPVLLGGIVLLVHAIAQLWPWIADVYENVSGLWWLWLAVLGAVLIVVAATYERRIREVKAVALAIRSLR